MPAPAAVGLNAKRGMPRHRDCGGGEPRARSHAEVKTAGSRRSLARSESAAPAAAGGTVRSRRPALESGRERRGRAVRGVGSTGAQDAGSGLGGGRPRGGVASARRREDTRGSGGRDGLGAARSRRAFGFRARGREKGCRGWRGATVGWRRGCWSCGSARRAGVREEGGAADGKPRAASFAARGRGVRAAWVAVGASRAAARG
jgi:hypothetical protein